MTTENNTIEKKYYYWETYDGLVKNLKNKIEVTPNIIIAIGKGGLIPGVILAEHYDITCLNLGLRSYDKYNQTKIQEYQSLDDHYKILQDANILIVDDIADTGETFKYTIKKLKTSMCERVQTASVFKKTHSSFIPDYYAEEINSNFWIVQPWEM
jgi:hypoxanthine phosphoribosyltransferase